jgi:hypothetical protein
MEVEKLCYCKEVKENFAIEKLLWLHHKIPLFPDNLPSRRITLLLPLFEDVLTKKEFDQLLLNHPWDHAIELRPDAVISVKGKVYPMDSKCEEELQKFLNKNLSTHRI